jgi:hypothetical protein
MPDSQQGRELHFEIRDCKEINTWKHSILRATKSPAETILYRYAWCITLELFVIKIGNCARNLLEYSIYIDVGIVTVQTLITNCVKEVQTTQKTLWRLIAFTWTMVAAPLSRSAREKPKPQTTSRLDQPCQKIIVRSTHGTKYQYRTGPPWVAVAHLIRHGQDTDSTYFAWISTTPALAGGLLGVFSALQHRVSHFWSKL